MYFKILNYLNNTNIVYLTELFLKKLIKDILKLQILVKTIKVYDPTQSERMN